MPQCQIRMPVIPRQALVRLLNFRNWYIFYGKFHCKFTGIVSSGRGVPRAAATHAGPFFFFTSAFACLKKKGFEDYARGWIAASHRAGPPERGAAVAPWKTRPMYEVYITFAAAVPGSFIPLLRRDRGR
ncbi:hypothetical protein EVAR_28577_1 [Eumeta japonica]|uniref:Uncharacterized protein n=1 Tax=Eumeta variegata TaxID=151549 RepID=A0A4C1UY48_EUMVA|nr:hypothetical protein EVAR_28577_1 [Eumeta japonica]